MVCSQWNLNTEQMNKQNRTKLMDKENTAVTAKARRAWGVCEMGQELDFQL